MLFLAIYDALKDHRRWALAALLVLVAGMAALALRLDYEEDISRFLPADRERQAYQAAVEALSNQQRIAIVFRGERDSVKTAMDAFEAHFAGLDTAQVVTDLQVTVDETRLFDVLSFVSQNAPYYLCAADYARIDSLLAQPNFIARQLNADKQLLMLPTGGVATQTITSDPLQLFKPLINRLQQTAANSRFTIDDGYIFIAENPQQSNQSPLPLGGVGGGSCALAFLSSPYGMSESARNAELAAMIDTVIARTAAEVPSVRVSAVGGPLIAVSNATQIKRDSMLAVGISVTLILALLLWHYRRLSDLLWIVAALGFGWLTAVAGMALLRGSMSVIVLGIGSVIIGIAVNYPLHFLDHLREMGDSRQALSDMVHPLLVGNITTVSAFLCLLWVDAAAMRDLGLFGALMLVGTILFVLVVMPQGAQPLPRPLPVREGSNYTDGGNTAEGVISLLPHREGPGEGLGLKGLGLFLFTLFLAYFSLQTSFDADLRHINYMTDGQREDMALLAQLSEDMPADALTLIPSAAEQQERLRLWDDFLRRHTDLATTLQAEAARQGFAADAFTPFYDLMASMPVPQNAEFFAPVAQFIGGQHLINAPNVGAQLVEILQDNFNYVSFVCGIVVFAFLWLSFRRIELALMAFLPLAVGWVWILGLMELLGIQFNIVNIILATFIFGQGDDYTIFITEGLIYEHTTGRRRLQSYWRSIMLSAALMFIGMGTLIVARHPALHSLGEVSIIGMGVVVLMANYLPPLVFRWLVNEGGLPVTVGRLGRSLFAMGFFLGVMYLLLLPFTWLYFHLGTMTEERRVKYHRLLQWLADFVIHRVPGVTFHLDNTAGETFERPAVIISNHQSHLDLMCLMMLTPKLVFLTNDWVWRNPFYGMVVHRAEFVPVSDGIENHLDQLRDIYRRGYCICVFPEGTRSDDCRILRFHKGAFYLAEQLQADIVPVYLHGPGHVLPKRDFMLRKGRIDVEIGERITSKQNQNASATLLERAKQTRHHYQEYYQQMCSRIETDDYWAPYRRLANYYRNQELYEQQL